MSCVSCVLYLLVLDRHTFASFEDMRMRLINRLSEL